MLLNNDDVFSHGIIDKPLCLAILPESTGFLAVARHVETWPTCNFKYQYTAYLTLSLYLSNFPTNLTPTSPAVFCIVQLRT